MNEQHLGARSKVSFFSMVQRLIGVYELRRPIDQLSRHQQGISLQQFATEIETAVGRENRVVSRTGIVPTDAAISKKNLAAVIEGT